MNLEQIKQTLKIEEYNFLRTNEYLGSNIILLGLGGSHAYNLAQPTSDIDIRGIALNSKEEILLSKDFEQVIDNPTDTVIYSFNKMINLLSENNPNTLEILFLHPEHYLYLSDIGQELLNNRDLFVSKKCISSFYGYSEQQARRMLNKAARKQSQEEFEQYILNTINNASYTFKERHFPYDDSSVNLYIDKSHQEGFNTEIYMDIDLKHYPLRDWTGLWNEMKAIVSSYTKFGKRNERAAAHDKLGKHQSCLIMLLMNAIDLLETGNFSVYQEGERRNLLMDIRNKKYLDDNSQPTEEFNDLLNEYKKRFEYAKKNTSLPDVPDYKRINEFKMYVNERIVRGDI